MTDPRASHRVPKRRVDGVLLLDKDVGRSSNAVLQHAKRLFNAAKAGHTGTLDPLASGLLPICFGEATKFAQLLLDADKSYLATLHLGITTTTGDAEGEVIERREAIPTRGAFEAVLPSFVGTISQQPPRHAALKYKGRSYYEYAREGVDIPRPAREVSIRSLRTGAWAPPCVEVAVECSKGTYVRVLAEDIGAALSCGAHLAALRRTATAGFNLADAVTLGALESMTPEQRDANLLPADSPCAALPRCELSTADAEALLEGRPVACPAMAEGVVRVYSAQRFVGIAEIKAGVLRARRLVANADG